MGKDRSKDIISSIAYWPVKVVIRLLGVLPMTVLYFISRIVQILVFELAGYRRKVIDRNLEIVFPDKNLSQRNSIKKEFKNHFFEMVAESLKTQSISAEELKDKFEIRLNDEMMESIQNGSDIIIAGAHINNWEWAVSAAGDQLPMRSVGIYKPLSNIIMDRLFKKMREKFGTIMVPMGDVIRDMYKKDRPPTAYLFLSDQSTPYRQKSHMISFFDVETPFVPGMGALAHRLNLPVFYFYIQKIHRGHYIATFETLIKEPTSISPSNITKLYVEKLEKNILNEAPNWLWTHKRWKRVLKY
ncbi:lysophospholipid acyltransferase family protein [Membranihabitans maritimus]|uniref:lysophospholipid acyltransferase family protein n=1 Tax=Membranihabitans maritimus TaxID=2904244 RepID=UPI001F1ECEEC|nr:lysophospholipid acyltransferase family protein [Membranihabitans maritimus]